MIDLDVIEQAIKDAIVALQRPYIALVATYGGEFDVSDERDFAQVISKFPAIWITFEGSGNIEPQGVRWRIPLHFTVLVGARSVRTEETARMGVTVDGKMIAAGTYLLIKDVITALLGQQLGLDITPLIPSKISTLFNTRTQSEAVSVLSISWKTSMVLDKDDLDTETQNADWMRLLNVDYVDMGQVATSLIDDVVTANDGAV